MAENKDDIIKPFNDNLFITEEENVESKRIRPPATYGYGYGTYNDFNYETVLGGWDVDRWLTEIRDVQQNQEGSN